MELFRANTPAVTSETFGTEVVLVNFDDGRYHTIDGVGVEIWKLLEAGISVDALVAALRARFAGAPVDIEETTRAFVASLAAAGLVRPADGAAGPVAAASAGPLAPFVPPVLTTYTDMQELLWLDPIHEVDERGWPSPRTT